MGVTLPIDECIRYYLLKKNAKSKAALKKNAYDVWIEGFGEGGKGRLRRGSKDQG